MDGMDILYLLVPLSLVLVFVIGAVFWWSLRNGQFDDLEGEGFRILMDDDKALSSREGNDTRESIDPDQSQSRR